VVVLITPVKGLDVAITLLDTSKGEGSVIAEVDEGGAGATETLSTRLPEGGDGKTMGVYTIVITTRNGIGGYKEVFSASPRGGLHPFG